MGWVSLAADWIWRYAIIVWSAMLKTYHDFDRHNYSNYAAALSYFCLLSVFPLLIFLASLLAFIPIPNLFEQCLEIMEKIVPPDAMGLVRRVLGDVLRTSPGLLSLSVLSGLFAASGGFASLIAILNIAHDAPETRPYWKKRVIAFGLTLLTGLMVAVLLIAIALGPQFGKWLATQTHVSWFFALLWPYARWVLIGAFTIFSVETIYFFAPNVKLRFKDQIPGAIIAVLSWIGASWALGWYLTHFTNYNKTFGALGAVVGLMLWFYVTALALLLGAEMNCELLRSRRKHSTGSAIDEKIKPPLALQPESKNSFPKSA
jgi:membrane protein